MDSSVLVKLLGFPATLIHGDTLVLDRWQWLKKHLPIVPEGSRQLLDVGCGTGGFTIGLARRGYKSLGLSWDERNQSVAAQRAAICNAPLASFEINDVRQLDQHQDLTDRFDIAICCENIEHILNDQKLIIDITRCLKPGGVLLLTTPNMNYKAITKEDNGPFSTFEDGWHVRRGYTPEMLQALCDHAGLKVSQIGYCSGFFSQKITTILRTVSRLNHLLAWAIILPLRILPPLLDPLVAKLSKWPGYSITLVAVKN